MIGRTSVSFKSTPVTLLCISVFALVHLLDILVPAPDGVSLRPFLLYGAIIPNLILDHDQWWRLFTALFLHLDFAHLAFNAVACLIFMSRFEVYLGKARTVMVFFLSGLAANLFATVVYALQGKAFIVALGASGGIMAILGASLAVMAVDYHRTRRLHYISYLQQIVVIILLQLVFDLFITENSMLVHMLGFLSGLIAGAALRFRQIVGGFDSSIR